jgi:hypothetical protein
VLSIFLLSVSVVFASAKLELATTLSGAAEVPGPGDPDGYGTASLGVRKPDELLCFKIQVHNIGAVTAAHVHQGTSDVSGPVVINLDVATNGLNACITADKTVVKAVFAHPEQYYINVHNAEFPAGALRGQLGGD